MGNIEGYVFMCRHGLIYYIFYCKQSQMAVGMGREIKFPRKLPSLLRRKRPGKLSAMPLQMKRDYVAW